MARRVESSRERRAGSETDLQENPHQATTPRSSGSSRRRCWTRSRRHAAAPPRRSTGGARPLGPPPAHPARSAQWVNLPGSWPEGSLGGAMRIATAGRGDRKAVPVGGAVIRGAWPAERPSTRSVSVGEATGSGRSGFGLLADPTRATSSCTPRPGPGRLTRPAVAGRPAPRPLRNSSSKSRRRLPRSAYTLTDRAHDRLQLLPATPFDA